MKKLVYIFILQSVTTFGQSAFKDSLRQVLDTLSNDSIKIRTICTLAYEVAMFSTDSVDYSVDLTSEAIRLAQANDNQFEEMRARYDRAWMYHLKGDLTKSKADSQRAIHLAQILKEDSHYHKNRDRLANILFEEGKKDEAIAIKYTSLAYFEKTRDTVQILATLKSLIHGYYIIGETEKAKKLGHRLINHQFESPMMIEVYGNLGILHMEEGSLDSAVLYMNIAGEMGVDYPVFLMNNQSMLAKVHFLRGDTATAISILENLDSLNALSDEKYIYAIKLQLSKYYLETDQLTPAIRKFKEAETGLDTENLYNQRRRGWLGQELYAKTANFQQALSYYKIYHAASDSMQQIKRDSAYKVIEAKYELSQKEEKIHKQQIKLRNLGLSFAGLMIVLMLLFFGFFLKYKDQTHRSNLLDLINKQQILQIANLKKDNKVIELRSIIEGQEEERKRIARDLHDNLGSIMATLKIKLLSIREAGYEAAGLNQGRQVDQMVTQVTDQIRRISHNMAPLAFGLSGLPAAVHELCSQLEAREICVEKDLSDLSRLKDQGKQIMIYRVLQEIINNIVKHSEASSVTLCCKAHENELRIRIGDDGKGMPANQWKFPTSMGLKSIKSRINYLNGTITIVRTRGTYFKISMPLG